MMNFVHPVPVALLPPLQASTLGAVQLLMPADFLSVVARLFRIAWSSAVAKQARRKNTKSFRLFISKENSKNGKRKRKIQLFYVRAGMLVTERCRAGNNGAETGTFPCGIVGEGQSGGR